MPEGGAPHIGPATPRPTPPGGASPRRADVQPCAGVAEASQRRYVPVKPSQDRDVDLPT
jgi:hypothetical protein